ncbi:hypothetical protein B1H10_03170 [candidate division KSB1 bacterium 4484_188]|nr:MAG: hypothetical protein B1H10_03170 [candidate division KSB1 bacterium 4484_188]HFE63255.1 hypothetical protein [Caldithrix sp.]
MDTLTIKNLNEFEKILEEPDKKLLLHFANSLLKREKYKKLRAEIDNRRAEIKKGEILSHDELWKEI